jgi:hypothetical protein
VIDQLADLPAVVCWVWPDRDPEPVRGAGDGWLIATAKSAGRTRPGGSRHLAAKAYASAR